MSTLVLKSGGGVACEAGTPALRVKRAATIEWNFMYLSWAFIVKFIISGKVLAIIESNFK
jgi:hypothetical protein